MTWLVVGSCFGWDVPLTLVHGFHQVNECIVPGHLLVQRVNCLWAVTHPEMSNLLTHPGPSADNFLLLSLDWPWALDPPHVMPVWEQQQLRTQPALASTRSIVNNHPLFGLLWLVSWVHQQGCSPYQDSIEWENRIGIGIRPTGPVKHSTFLLS